MIIQSLINQAIPFLKPSDNVRLAKNLFLEYKLSKLPYVEENLFLGFISEEFLLDISPLSKLSTLQNVDNQPKVNTEIHFLDALKIMNLYNSDILAIVSEDELFSGIVLKSDIIDYISKLGYINSLGGILILSVLNSNYSLSEISRIVESNDMKILFLAVEDNPEDGYESFITIKLNKLDLTRLIASFERFGYTIEADFHESTLQPIENERLEMLMRYLNV